jgi:acetoin utilization deacetylase AcuC-like enzyme
MTDHDMGRWHPERPDRLRAIVRRLEADPVPGMRWSQPRSAALDPIRRIHQAPYVRTLEALRGRTAQLDPDTSVSPGSIDAMHLAVGAALGAVEAVVRGEADRACALVRPPGHHAESNTSKGFCLVNNIAIAAEHARQALGCERVLVVDWDVHHGNGTQNSFYGRSDILYFSSHRYPFFPGSGWFDEVGEGAGAGYTVNIPLPQGLGDAEHVAVYRDLLVPIADAFRPDLVLVSAGYDAHHRDPLGGMQVTDDGFGAIAGIVRDIADRHAGGRLVALLEGGYDLDALAAGVHGTLSVLAGAPPPRMTDAPAVGFDALLQRVRDHHHEFWPL